MFRNIKRFLVNGISVIGQKLVNIFVCVAGKVQRIYFKVKNFIKDMIELACRIFLNTIDFIKNSLHNKEIINSIIIAIGSTISVMVLFYLFSGDSLLSFLIDWFKEEALEFCIANIFIIFVFLLRAVVLWRRQEKEKNMSNGYKVTNYKLFGQTLGNVYYELTKSRSNSNIITPTP